MQNPLIIFSITCIIISKWWKVDFRVCSVECPYSKLLLLCNGGTPLTLGYPLKRKGEIRLFRSEHFHNVDAKGRMIVPARFRDALSNQFIITKGLDKCLFIFTMEEWQILEQKAEELPMTDPAARRFVRFFFGAASEGECDEQGRVLIPQSLRQYADITKEIVTVGTGRRIEVWNKQNYEIYMSEDSLEDDIRQSMSIAQLKI